MPVNPETLTQPPRRRRNPAPISINATLGGAGVAQTHRAAQAQAAPAPVRHANQRAELQQLTETVIPALVAARQRLSVADPLDLTLTGPTELDRRSELVNVERRLGAAQARASELAGKVRARRGARAEPVTALETITALLGAIPPVRAAQGAGLGLRALLSALGKGGESAATRAAPTAAQAIATRAGEAAGSAAARGGVRGAAERAAGKIPHPYTAARGAIARGGAAAASRAAEKIATTRVAEAVARAAARPGAQVATKVGLGAAKVAGKPVGYAVRHPFKAPVVAQAPIVLAEGDPREFGKAFTGEGILATGLNAAGEAVAPGGVVGNAVRDAFALPSSVLPSVYLPAAGAVEALQGDSSRLEQLWREYESTGLLPAIASGDPSAVLRAATEHPLFTALEASGGYAAVGRGAGAVARGGVAREAGSTARDPLTVYGKGEGGVAVPRSYSKNLISKAIQRALEERQRRQGRDPNQADAKLAEKILTGKYRKVPVLEGHRNIPIGLVHRFMDSREKVRRENRQDVNKDFLAKEPDKGSGVVSEIVQGSVRSPATWREDLSSRLADLQAEDAQGNLTGSERPLNHELQASIKSALKLDDPRQIQDVFDAADEFLVSHKPLIEKLIEKGVLDPAQAERAIRMVYAKRHMGATRGRSKKTADQIEALKASLATASPKEKVGIQARISALSRKRELIDAEGKIITTEGMREHMEANGVDASFLTHRPGVTGRGSHYRAAVRRPSSASRTRGGESFDRGAYESGFKALAAQLRQSRTIVDQAGTIDAFAKRFGTGPGDGREFFGDWDEGALIANELNANPELARAAGIPEGLELVPMRIDNARAKTTELESIDRNAAPEGMGLLDPLRDTPGLVPKRIEEIAQESFKPGRGKVVLVPKVVREEFLSHQAPASAGMRSFQSVNQQFKTVVLPGSSKWVLGNAAELQIRQLANGIAPFPLTLVDPRYHLGRRLLTTQKELNPEAAQEFRAQTVGTAFTGEEMLQMHQGGNRIADAIERLRATPGPGTLLRAYEAYARWMFRTQEAMERVGTTAGIGKEATRQIREQNKSVTKALALHKPALEELARGSLHTKTQLTFAHAVEDMYGRWKANSPEVRKTLLQLAPFWMWTRAATRFVALTLPLHHPIKTSLIAMATEMTETERERLGLDVLSPNPLPANLQGSIPLPGGAILPSQYYSSFGVFANYPDSLANAILPQVSGPLANLAGVDWKGDKLRNPDGSYTSTQQNVGLAANSILEAFIPGLAISRRIQEGGGSPASTSTAFSPQTTDTNPGEGLLSGLAHVFVPQSLPAGLVDYLRERSHSQEITIPVDGSPSASSGSSDSTNPRAPWVGAGSASSGSSTAPWVGAGSSGSGTAPWVGAGG